MFEGLRAVLRPSVLTAGKLNELTYEFEAGLLVVPCSPEGTGYRETEEPGYARQRVRMTGAANGALHAQNEVVFEFERNASTNICQIALFDANNCTVAYGYAIPTSHARPSVASVSIKAVDLRLLR